MNKIKINKRKLNHSILKDESFKKCIRSFLGEGLVDRNEKKIPGTSISNIKNFVKSFN
jgi:hypothetical protein